MSEKVTVGSLWVNKKNGRTAKVVQLSVSITGCPLQYAEVVYGPKFEPSILPSTWLLRDWDELFTPYEAVNP